MRPNTIEEMLEVLTAWKEGKRIEYYDRRACYDWEETLHPNWDFSIYTYRIMDTDVKRDGNYLSNISYLYENNHDI